MDNYPESQLKAASEILEILSVPLPHTLQEKIRAIEASKAVLAVKFQDDAAGYYTAMRKVANEIKIDRLRQEHNSIKNDSTKLCFTERITQSRLLS